MGERKLNGLDMDELLTIGDLRSMVSNEITCSVEIFQTNLPYSDYSITYQDIDDVEPEYDICKVEEFYYTFQRGKRKTEYGGNINPHAVLKIYVDPDELDRVERFAEVPVYISRRIRREGSG